MADTTKEKAEVDLRTAAAAADKADADARTARIAADKAQRELAEWDSALAREARDADQRKKVADSQKAALDAQRAVISSMIPDLKDVERGETKLSGDQPLFRSVLAHRALGRAITGIVATLRDKTDTKGRVLITADADLATPDATYADVRDLLTELDRAAARLLEAVPAEPPSESPADSQRELAPEDLSGLAATAAPMLANPIAAGIGAVAAALPPVISLFSARRTLSSQAIAADDTAAIAEVAGALANEQRRVVLDDFRLVPNGEITALDAAVRSKRAELVDRRMRYEQERVAQDARRTSFDGRIDRLTKLVDAEDSSKKADYPKWRTDLEQSIARREEAAGAAKQAAVVVTVLDALVARVDSTVSAVRTIPQGSKRSPLATAALREQLRTGGTDGIGKVLYLKAAAGSADQLMNDKPLWLKDRFHVIAGVSVSYWLLDTRTSEVVAAGVAHGTEQITGKVGDKIENL